MWNNCLRDPPGKTLHSFGGPDAIGGRCFYSVQALPGTSAMEGWHAHRKERPGTFAQQAPVVGDALLKEGALRWNRAKRARTP